MCCAGRSAPSQCGVVTGSGFSSPNQPDQVRTTAYHDGSGPDSRSDAHSAIIVGGWEKQSGESRIIWLTRFAWPSPAVGIVVGIGQKSGITRPSRRAHCCAPPTRPRDRGIGGQGQGCEGNSEQRLGKRCRQVAALEIVSSPEAASDSGWRQSMAGGLNIDAHKCLVNGIEQAKEERRVA